QQRFEREGRLSGGTILSAEEASTSVFGVRYLPTFTAEKDFSGERTADTEISANAYASGPIGSSSDLDVSGRVKPYRVWGRYKTPRYEARVGLQKPNFASATLLRPSMWFDSVDPRDPF